MSRSYRKTLRKGNCGSGSEKQFKRMANKRHRRTQKQVLAIGGEDADLLLPIHSGYGPKDGKFWFGWGDMVKKLKRK